MPSPACARPVRRSRLPPSDPRFCQKYRACRPPRFTPPAARSFSGWTRGTSRLTTMRTYVRMRTYRFTLTEYDSDRPWIVRARETQTVTLADEASFFEWAHEHWLAATMVGGARPVAAGAALVTGACDSIGPTSVLAVIKTLLPAACCLLLLPAACCPARLRSAPSSPTAMAAASTREPRMRSTSTA